MPSYPACSSMMPLQRRQHRAENGDGDVERRLFRYGLIAAAVIIAPIFLDISGGGLALAPSYVDRASTAGNIVPISVVLVPTLGVLAVGAFALRRGGRVPAVRWEDAIVLVYATLHIAACLWGLLVGRAQVPGSILLVLQALYPIAAYLLARVLVETHRAVCLPPVIATGLQRGFLVGLAWVGGLALVGYLVQTAIDGFQGWRFGLIADHIGPFYNYKMKRYFSIYLAIISGTLVTYALLARTNWRRAVAAIGGSLFGLTAILVTHSRTAVGTFLVVVMVGAAGVVDAMSGRIRRRGAIAIAVAVALGATVAVNTPIEQARAVLRVEQTLAALAGEDRLDRGDVRRFEAWETGVTGSFAGFFGTAYEVRRRSGGAKRVVNTESGYLDISARAGLPALLSALLILAVTGWRATENALWMREASLGDAVWVSWSISGTMVATLVVIVPFITSLGEPYLGPALWFTMGTLVQRHPSGE